MPAKTAINNNRTNNIINFEKENYVSCNSSNPYTRDKYESKLRKTFRLERGIVGEVNDGTVVISCLDKLIDLKLYFRRDSDKVTFISKIHQHLRCTEEPRVSWYGSEGYPEGQILKLNSKGQP